MTSFCKRAVAVCVALFLCLTSAANAASAQEKPFTLLIIGVDTEDDSQAGRSDAIILAQINPITGDVRLLSFLRDLYVSVPGHGKTRLNAAYFYGGTPLLMKTLEKNFGVSADRAVAVNFSLMADLVDQVGGVELDITEAERKQLNDILQRYNRSAGVGVNSGLVSQSGLVRLGGKQTLSFSRIRKIDSDFQRASRQQRVLTALLGQLRQQSKLKLLKLAIQNLPHLETDLTLSDFAALIPLLTASSAPALRTAHVPFAGAYADETINGMMVLVPNLERNRSKIQAFLSEE